MWAAILYNQTQGQVELLAASTLGVLYIVEKGGETVTDIKSLAGKTIYATGKGATPEYALTYLLAQNGLTLGEDVTVEWKSEPTEIVKPLWPGRIMPLPCCPSPLSPWPRASWRACRWLWTCPPSGISWALTAAWSQRWCARPADEHPGGLCRRASASTDRANPVHAGRDPRCGRSWAS